MFYNKRSKIFVEIFTILWYDVRDIIRTIVRSASKAGRLSPASLNVWPIAIYSGDLQMMMEGLVGVILIRKPVNRQGFLTNGERGVYECKVTSGRR